MESCRDYYECEKLTSLRPRPGQADGCINYQVSKAFSYKVVMNAPTSSGSGCPRQVDAKSKVSFQQT